ncbi:hypothetical protein TNCV_959061 [Trichonephila clavipes]|nr:hypothetical protein TNCV_959061 [Trichonephila clavipes]
MNDNASKHRAHLIRHMDWPVKSPDLNLIDHVWDALGRRNATFNHPSRTIQERKTALLNEWTNVHKN